MNNAGNQLNLLLILFITLLTGFLFIEYLVIFDSDVLGAFGSGGIHIVKEYLLPYHLVWKVLYVFFIFMLMSTSKRRRTSLSVSGILFFSVLTLLSLTYLVSIRETITWMNIQLHLAAYPISFFGLSIGVARMAPDFLNSMGFNVKNISRDERVGLSRHKSRYFDIKLKTQNGPLIINSPFRHTWTIGSAGSGKSKSIIDPMIYQMMLSGFTGVVYDFKGTPLTETVLKAHQYLQNNRPGNYTGKLPEVNMITFTNIEKSVRLNVISPEYITSSLAAKNAATSLAYALDREWVRKRDFWSNSAIGLIHATIWNMAKNHPNYCTLPHVIAAITAETDLFTNWLVQDDEIARLVRPITEALEKKANEQVQGVLASVRNPMNSLLNPELFWIFSGDDINLQVNNPEHPQWLCVCNDMDRREGISPALSVLLTLLNKVLNRPGMRPVLYAIDELPTVYIHGLSDYMATCRSNDNAVLLGLQTYSQLEKEYQRDEAAIIKGNCANQFWGVVDVNEAEKVSKAFGQYDRERSSTSIGDSGASDSFNYERVDILTPSDIRTKRAGEFVGFVADGKPALFDARFKMLDSYYRNTEGEVSFPLRYPDHQYLQSLIEANYQTIFEETKELLENV